MATTYVAKRPGSVSRYEYFASDVSGVPLTFKRTAADVLTSECGRYQVVRMDIGGECVFDANAIEEGRVTCLAFEGSSADAKRACEKYAGKVARELLKPNRGV